MNVRNWWDSKIKKMTRGRAAALLALALLGSFITYECVKPARAADALPSAAPLDDDSVGALTALDKAMETLAAHVTPAVVNVTVTSRAKQQQLSDRDQDEIQR